MKREIGISISRPVENVFSCGLFDCIEYDIGANFDLPTAFEDWEANTKNIKELCKKYKVRLHSYHLPFNGERLQGHYMHEPASLDKAVRDKTFEQTKRLIENIADMGMRFVILHGSLRVQEEERSQIVDYFVEYVQRLCDFCKPYGIVVAVETLLESCIGGGGDVPENRIDEHRYIITNVKRDNVGICLDNNHFIKSDSIEFVKELGEYIVTTHFSDYDGVAERHAMPGCGITDWKRLTSLLEEKGYSGPWMFEIGFSQRGNPSDAELEELICRWNDIMN